MKWTLEKRKISDLHEYAKNPRRLSKLQGDHLRESLSKFGQCDIIQINTDNTIIGGHQRVRTLKKMGAKEVDVYVPSRTLDDKEVEELCIRLNKNTGDFDVDMLANMWDLPDLMEWGFTEEELSVDIDIMEGKEPEDEADAVQEESKTKTGDLYQLGNHRLLCGSSTVATDVKKLIGDDLIQMLCTDPPYGVNYSDKNKFLNKWGKGKGNRNQTEIKNDNIENYKLFFSEFLSLIPWSDYNTSYIFMSGSELHNVRLAMEECGMKWGDYLIWLKNNHVLGRKDYNSKHEFIVYGWKGRHKFFGPSNSVTTIECARPNSSKEHPTMKPIELVSRLIKDGSEANYKIYDPFVGSGTTLLACENLDRTCFAMEMSPNYCDVVIKRWIKYRKEQNLNYDVVRNNEKVDW